MGNGVNITARLQTYAKPRGLCVSQTIFDVVKARLSLHATFLGPLYLKNIHEPVPAYQLTLQAEPDVYPCSTGEPTYTRPISVDALLSQAVRNLTTADQSLRIKKLVFATYQQAWENDRTVLAQFDLPSLLMFLRERYPTLSSLESQFQRVVLGLNRQDIYAEVAALILRELQPWYERSLRPTPQALQNDTTVLTLRSLDERCRLVTQNLQRHGDFLRLRKLLYCLCHNIWENNPTVLDQVDCCALIQQVLQLAPQSQDLRYHLGRVTKRLNRPRQYTHLANQLIEQFQVLYLDQPAGAQLSTPAGSDSQDSAPDHTVVTPLPRASATPGEFTQLQSALAQLPPKAVPASCQGKSPVQGRDRALLFDLRVDILQYVNPLRAKILLYSCLHGPFGYTPQDWADLSHTTLDDLLRQIFDYCPNFGDLDSKLTITAHCLGQSSESMPVASTIIQAMRAYY
ncbi:MAG: hypothetical protein HC929_13490 [Leptolyngbyaceae cyanobacterium SM2_5_2]|nr:hypothetical protein [Leptolyngbyaceae cyanobacterium SM2_5_2]